MNLTIKNINACLLLLVFLSMSCFANFPAKTLHFIAGTPTTDGLQRSTSGLDQLIINSIDSKAFKSQITEQLQIAIDTKNRRQLFETTKQIYAIWRGEKDAGNLWIALRDKQAKSLLQSLELLHEHVDWQFDKTKFSEDTLDPPLDYSIMGYSKGFGTRLIEDPILKAEIKAKLKVELSRLKKAKLERSFQRQVNNHYDSWLGAFLRLLRNSFSEKNAQSNKAYITNLTKQTLKPSEFRDFALYVISSFYDQEKEIIAQINKHQGNCKSLLKR